jgi:hypothetical protein
MVGRGTYGTPDSLHLIFMKKAAPALLAGFLSRTLLIPRMYIMGNCDLSVSHWLSYISVDKGRNYPRKAEPEI